MDVRDEMSLSKDDPSPKSSSLRVSDQNKHRNKLIGVKDKPQVGSLSPRKWRTRDMIVAAKHGDKVLNVQPVSEFNPTTGIQVLKPLVVEKPEKVKDKALVKKPADVVEKPEKVKDKATLKNPAVVAMVKKPANVVDKPAVLVKENDVVPDVGLEKVVSNDKDLSDFVSNKRRRRTELPKLNAPADVADKESDVVNNKDKESDVADKELDVDKDKFGANELLSDVVSKKRRRRTELPKVNAPAVMADKPLVEKSVVKPAVKPVVKPAIKRAVKASLKPAVKGNESKKLKSKSEDSDESVLDRKMKHKKNEKELTPSDVAHEEYLKHFPTLHVRAVPKSLFAAIQGSQVDMWRFLSEIGFNSFHNLAIDEIPSRVGRFCVANFNSHTYKLCLDSGDSIHVTPSKIHDVLGIPVGGISLFSLEARPVEHEFVKSWVDQFSPKRLKKIRVGDIASKLIFAHKVDFLFKVNFLTLFTNTIGRVAGLKGEICLDVLLYFDSTKFDGFPIVRTRPAIRAWNSTLMRQREKLELKEHVLGLLELHDESTGGGSMLTTEKENLIKKAEEKLSIVCSERVFLEGCLMTASEKYPGDRKFFEIHKKYAEVFKNPIEFGYHESSLGDDGNGDDDTGNGDDDAEVDDVANEDDYDNVDENDSSVIDKEVHVEDDGNRVVDGNGDVQDDNGGSKKQVESTEKQSVDPTDPTGEENVFEEENDITCTPESYTQWLDANADFVLEGDALDAINLDIVRMEESDAVPVTPERLATRVSKLSPSPEKRRVKPSSYLLSPYMNKTTKVLPKITRLEFIVGNSLFAMRGDKIEHVFETSSGLEKVFGIRLNMETLAPGLWIDANVVDCWSEVLNYEERFRKAGSLSRHFFPTGCITLSMFDGTYATDEERWENFSAQVSAQFKDNVNGLSLNGIDLKKLFTRHLKLYGHQRHSKIQRLKAKILKMKWKTKINFRDCGIFTMLHMESYSGQTASTWDCGLVSESKLQCDMLRRLRFKFATKILLHEINVHAPKMLELAKEFDKLDSREKLSIVVEAAKNRGERERS
ncbi:integrase, catalytic region, zinc finger, CCHC-type containing protein [Tanacetum coccineum]